MQEAKNIDEATYKIKGHQIEANKAWKNDDKERANSLHQNAIELANEWLQRIKNNTTVEQKYKDQDSAILYGLAAKSYSVIEEYNDAIKYAEARKKLRPDDIFARRDLISIYIDAEDTNNAKREAYNAIDKYSKSKDTNIQKACSYICCMLSKVYRRENLYEQAIEIAHQAVSIYPNNISGYFSLTLAQTYKANDLMENDKPRAMIYYRDAINNGEKGIRQYNQDNKNSRKSNILKQKIGYAKNAIIKATPEIKYEIQSCFKKKRFDDVVNLAQSFLGYKEDRDVNILLIKTYQLRPDLGDPITEAEKAAATHDKIFVFNNMAARYALKNNNLPKAEEHAKENVRRIKKWTEKGLLTNEKKRVLIQGHSLLGEVNILTGNKSRVRRCASFIQKKDSNNPYGLKLEMSFHLMNEKPERAEKAFFSGDKKRLSLPTLELATKMAKYGLISNNNLLKKTIIEAKKEYPKNSAIYNKMDQEIRKYKSKKPNLNGFLKDVFGYENIDTEISHADARINISEDIKSKTR